MAAAAFVFPFAVFSFESEQEFFTSYGFCLHHDIEAEHTQFLGLRYLFVFSVDGFLSLNAFLVEKNYDFTLFSLQNFPL